MTIPAKRKTSRIVSVLVKQLDKKYPPEKYPNKSGIPDNDPILLLLRQLWGKDIDSKTRLQMETPEIYRLHRDGVTVQELSKRYHHNNKTISRVLKKYATAKSKEKLYEENSL